MSAVEQDMKSSQKCDLSSVKNHIFSLEKQYDYFAHKFVKKI